MKKLDQERLKLIKLLILDVDGVLTDGKIIYNDRGEEIKAFDVKDGHGIKLLMRSGMEIALITGRKSEVVLHRARDLGIEQVYQKVTNKMEVYEKILNDKKLEDENVGFVGDDLVDIPVLKRVGFSAAVLDAVSEVKEIADYIASKKGGGGAVREICELLLKAQNKWKGVTERYQ
ncbi:MAG: HAD-IIIA family hydrolase [Deltaproteobacteria bacterium]|nr:HAD-IIIA family hydrolase [Deltaproteobacteria bacterium]